MGNFGRLRARRMYRRYLFNSVFLRYRGFLIMVQKLTFNRAGWIVIAIEENNYFRHLRFDTVKAAREFLKANPDAWFCG
jgi:hypothetical protein